MKPNRKIINMDYRGQTAQTKGMFAEEHWPRNDEIISHELHRSDRRVSYQRNQRNHDAPVREHDQHDMNVRNMAMGRRCM